LRNFIINKFTAKTQRRRVFKAIFISAPLRLCGLILLFTSILSAQKIAVLTPEKNGQSENFAEKLETSLAAKFKVLNSSMSEAAFLASNPEKPFNMAAEDAKITGAAIGCDFFLLVKSENLRRSSFEKKDYFESYAAVYAVSSRTGRLVFWRLKTFNGYDPKDAEKLLFDSTGEIANEISERLPAVFKDELNEKPVKLEGIPDENSTDAKNFRTPLPYKRISPPYTALANLYSIAATVDIEVDFDESGKILRTDVVRWAGFGLDEAVTETVRKMNWRPATRSGKPLPVRVLLRYNFKKLDKEE